MMRYRLRAEQWYRSTPAGTGTVQQAIRVIILTGIMAAFISVAPSVFAASPPDVQNYEFYAYGNVFETDNGGDLLIIGRGELPYTSWCNSDALVDVDGCTSDPTNPTSLITDVAILRIYTDCATISTCTTTGTFKKQATLRRIGDLLTGVYMDALHGVIWGETGTGACIIAPATYWDSENSACAAVSWRPSSAAAGDIATTANQLALDTVGMMKALEQAYNLAPGTWVEQEKINATGRPYVLEAYPLLNIAAPSAFQAGANRPELFVTPVSTSTARIDNHLATQRAGSGLVENFDNLAKETLNMDGVTVGKFVVFILGFVLVGVANYIAPAKPVPMLVGFGLPFIPGMWLWIPFSWIGAVIILLLVFAVAAIVKVIPN